MNKKPDWKAEFCVPCWANMNYLLKVWVTSLLYNLPAITISNLAWKQAYAEQDDGRISVHHTYYQKENGDLSSFTAFCFQCLRQLIWKRQNRFLGTPCQELRASYKKLKSNYFNTYGVFRATEIMPSLSQRNTDMEWPIKWKGICPYMIRRVGWDDLDTFCTYASKKVNPQTNTIFVGLDVDRISWLCNNAHSVNHIGLTRVYIDYVLRMFPVKSWENSGNEVYFIHEYWYLT